MAQIILNFAVAVFIASVFLTIAMSTLAGKDRSLQKVPATIRTKLNQNSDRRPDCLKSMGASSLRQIAKAPPIGGAFVLVGLMIA